MNLLFVHDHIFSLSDDNTCYSPGKYDVNSFDRYLSVFDSVHILSRYKLNTNADELYRYNQIKSERLSFIPFENQSNLINRFVKRPLFKTKVAEILSDYDAIVVRIPSEIGFLVASVARELGKPYICEVVACPKDAMKGFGSLRSSLYSPIITAEMKKCVKNAFGALYVTHSFLQLRYPCVGHSYSASNVEIEKIIHRVSADIENKNTVIVTLIGHLDSVHKGYPVVHEALNILSNKSDRFFEVNLVGAGDKFKVNQKFDNINIVYTGALKKHEINTLLDNTDLYIQPSNQEGLPRATIEAMSRGVPCIVSTAGGLPELIDSKFTHDVGDASVLAKKIIDITSNNVEGLRIPHLDGEALMQGISYALNAKCYRDKIMNSSIDFERSKVLSQYEKVLSI